ncbi:MAG TPA: hypothetical protein VKI65_06395 [Gemmataceae bacterium]|nr:hypothetical protein [Gemmataceae bacterium]
MDLQEEILRRDLFQFRLYFNSRDARQARAAAWIHTIDVWSQVELVDSAAPAERPMIKGRPESQAIQAHSADRVRSDAEPPKGIADADRLHLVTKDNEVLTGYPLFERLVRSLRLLWPLALLTWLPGFAGAAHIRYPGSVEIRKEGARPISDRPPTRETAFTGSKKGHG